MAITLVAYAYVEPRRLGSDLPDFEPSRKRFTAIWTGTWTTCWGEPAEEAVPRRSSVGKTPRVDSSISNPDRMTSSWQRLGFSQSVYILLYWPPARADCNRNHAGGVRSPVGDHRCPNTPGPHSNDGEQDARASSE